MASPRQIAPAAPLGSPEPPGDERVKKVTMACLACRQRRSKCTGTAPCKRCELHQIECVFDETADLRRKASAKRKLEEFNETRMTLMNVLEAIRSPHRNLLDDLQKLVRGEASLVEISTYLETHISRSREKGPTADLASQELEQVLHQVRSLDGLGSEPPAKSRRTEQGEQVPAKPWTDVTDDDDLVSDLISLFFAWSHPFTCAYVDREPFLEGMKTGNLKSDFCSPFLVNIILAEACPYSDSEAQSNLSELFIAEAKHHWETEGGRTCLTNLQGLTALAGRTVLRGNDRMGWFIYKQADAMYQNFERDSKRLATPDSEVYSNKERARLLAGWGLYNQYSMVALSLLKPAHTKQPNGWPFPTDEPADCGRWTPYPLQQLPRPSHQQCVFKKTSEISIIINALANLYYGLEHRTTNALGTSLKDLFERLKAIHRTFPPCLSLEGLPPAHVICLHALYHWTLIVLFGFLNRFKVTSVHSESPKISESTFQSYPETVCITSARKIGAIIELYHDLFGLDHICISMIQSTSVALFTLLPDLHSLESRRAFLQISETALAVARLCSLAAGMIKMVQMTAKDMNIDLPPDARSYFEKFEVEIWAKQDTSKFHADYPNFTFATGRDPSGLGITRLSELIESWESLKISKPDGTTKQV